MRGREERKRALRDLVSHVAADRIAGHRASCAHEMRNTRESQPYTARHACTGKRGKTAGRSNAHSKSESTEVPPAERCGGPLPRAQLLTTSVSRCLSHATEGDRKARGGSACCAVPPACVAHRRCAALRMPHPNCCHKPCAADPATSIITPGCRTQEATHVNASLAPTVAALVWKLTSVPQLPFLRHVAAQCGGDVGQKFC